MFVCLNRFAVTAIVSVITSLGSVISAVGESPVLAKRKEMKAAVVMESEKLSATIVSKDLEAVRLKLFKVGDDDLPDSKLIAELVDGELQELVTGGNGAWLGDSERCFFDRSRPPTRPSSSKNRA